MRADGTDMDTPPDDLEAGASAPDSYEDALAALRRELGLALRACTPKERLLLSALPKYQHQIWRAADRIGIPKGSVQNMLRRPRFQRARQALDAIGLAELCVSERMLIAEYVALAKANLQDFHDANGNPLPPHLWPPEWSAAVQEYYVDKDGVARIKLHDKSRPLDALAKYKRIVTDRVEVTGKDGGPIVYKSADDLTDEQLAIIAAGGGAAPAKSEAGEG